ncbi:MAG: amidase family protein, partial [Actinomycetota bacterium]
MTAPDLATATTVQLLMALERREVSSVELLDAMSANIDRLNPAVNAVVATDMERARAEAVAADDSRAAGEECGPLHGLPMTIKDCYETLDLVTTAGAPELAEHVPTRDADVVRLLRRAGAIVWAKTNVPYYAGDHQTYNEVYGVTNNPWDLTRTAGGSSGGAAVAVACGFTTAEVGSDIGGSIRQPAGLNGVFGVKTTHGLVSGRGHVPGPPGALASGDLGVFGPMGRSCGDLRILLEVLTNSTTAFGGVPGAQLPRFETQPDIADLRIGVWSDDEVSPVDASVKHLIEAAAKRLADEGARVDAEIRPSIPSSDLHRTYIRLLNTAMSGGIPARLWDRIVEKAGGSEEMTDDDAVMLARDSALSHRTWLSTDDQRAHAGAA